MLGGVTLNGSGQNTLSGAYSDFPALKHMFIMEGGTGTHTTLDLVGDVVLPSKPWVATNSFSGYQEVADEVTEHNKDLDSGSSE